jgi:biopolymer transport protein ExbD
MRRFSQRQQLVTLSDINITPLLDLAFVLLIIFVITTPLLEQGINLRLPVGGLEDPKKIDAGNVWTVEVATNGYYFAKSRWWYLQDLAQQLAMEYRKNPALLVYVRADEEAPYRFVAAVLNRLEQAGIEQVSLRTAPPKK